MIGAHKNFKLHGICVKENNPIVERSIFSLVNQIINVDKIKYKGIPLAIPIKKIKINFFEK